MTDETRPTPPKRTVFKLGSKNQRTSDATFVTGKNLKPNRYARSTIHQKLLHWHSKCRFNLPDNYPSENWKPSTPTEANAHCLISHIQNAIKDYNNGDSEQAFDSFLNAAPFIEKFEYLKHELEAQVGKAKLNDRQTTQHERTLEWQELAKPIYKRRLKKMNDEIKKGKRKKINVSELARGIAKYLKEEHDLEVTVDTIRKAISEKKKVGRIDWRQIDSCSDV